MICDIITLCVAKHEELARKAEGDGARGGVPRVATIGTVAHSEERNGHAEQRQGKERRVDAQPKEEKGKRKKERPTRRKSNAFDRDELNEALEEVDTTPLHPQHILLHLPLHTAGVPFLLPVVAPSPLRLPPPLLNAIRSSPCTRSYSQSLSEPPISPLPLLPPSHRGRR